jgi:hypothetical protein
MKVPLQSSNITATANAYFRNEIDSLPKRILIFGSTGMDLFTEVSYPMRT